jgi:hypothetical protein
MQRHLILHIGLSKTGSSSIQRVLAANREAMQAQRTYMPHSPGWANHALLPAALVNDPKILWGFHPATWEGLTPAARLARFRAEWAAEMAALPDWAERCVITAEQIAGLLRTDVEVARLAALLRPHFGQVTVVAYLRRQDLHAASAYSQWLRGGVMVEPGLPEGGVVENPDYDYGAMLDRFARAFGDAAVRPRIFDRASLQGGDVVEDFCQLAELRLPPLADAAKKNSNLGITLQGQALLLASGRHFAARAAGTTWRDTPQWRRLAESVSEAMAGRGWRPTQAEAAAFMARFAATNEHARSRFLPQLPELFPLDFSELPAEPVILPTADLVAGALDVLVHEMDKSAVREWQAAMNQYRLLKRLEDRPGMRQALVRAIKFGPDEMLTRLRAAEFFLEEGDMTQAREHAQVARALAPDHPKVRHLVRRIERAEAPGGGAAPPE